MILAFDAEQQVLGSLMLDTRRLPDVAEMLSPGHLANRHHQRIYRAILALYDAGEPIDVVTVADRLERTGHLEAVGGLAYVGQLAQAVAATANVTAYAQAVAEKSLNRALKRAGAEIAQLVEEDCPLAQKLDRASEILLSLGRDAERGDLTPIGDILARVIDDIERRFEQQGRITGDPTGFEALDERWDGLNPGDLIVLAARPAMGKTALAMNIAAHVARSRPVAVFELEMPGEQLAKRQISAAGTLPFRKVKRGALTETDWPKLTAAIGEVHGCQLFIDDRAAQTLSRIRTFARKVRRQQRDLGLIVVDYLQIMDDEARRGENRTLAIQRITMGFKALAKELACPVLLLSQLSRETEKRSTKKPQLSDLRDSGSIEQDSDIVALMHRADVYRPDDEPLDHLCEVITAKNRNGETGSDFLEWQGEFQRFVPTHRTPDTRTTRPAKSRGVST